jgi:hypothetical protein
MGIQIPEIQAIWSFPIEKPITYLYAHSNIRRLTATLY